MGGASAGRFLRGRTPDRTLAADCGGERDAGAIDLDREVVRLGLQQLCVQRPRTVPTVDGGGFAAGDNRLRLSGGEARQTRCIGGHAAWADLRLPFHLRVDRCGDAVPAGTPPRCRGGTVAACTANCLGGTCRHGALCISVAAGVDGSRHPQSQPFGGVVEMGFFWRGSGNESPSWGRTAGSWAAGAALATGSPARFWSRGRFTTRRRRRPRFS